MQRLDRERLIEELVQRYRDSLERHLHREPRTIDEIEQVVEDVSVEMDREMEQRILDQQEEPRENQAQCPQCAGVARYRARCARVLITRHGERALRRRYYYCRDCKSGFAPLDGKLGLDAGATTPAVRLFAVRLAAHLPFGEAARILELLTGVVLGASTVERITVGVGSALRAAQHQTGATHHDGRGPTVERKPRRLYISVDGLMAPLREAWKKDGSAGSLQCRFGECKTAVVFEARPGKAAGQSDAGVLWREYVATFGTVDRFGPLVATLAHRCGQHYAREVVFLADGQAYNWTLAAAHFPEAIQIVDYMHAVQHLYEVIHAFLGEGSKRAGEWVAARKEELFADRVASVIEAIVDLPAQSKEHKEAQRRAAGYFRNNAERMRYGTFRKHGYEIASGVMEAGCKHVVHQRLDQAGMHWRPETAEAVVALRAAELSSHKSDLRPYCRMTQ
jgi:hypothetical protein